MRSPFYYFRRNQKALLAIFGVALMVAFTLTVGGFTMVDLFLSPSQEGTDMEDVVVTFKGGSLTEGELAMERRRHNAVRAYLQKVVDQTFEKGGTPGFRRLRMSGDSDKQLLHTSLLAQRAEELGIVISNEAITDYLTELSDGKLTLEELDKIREDSFGKDVPFSVLHEALRQELAARSVEELILSGLVTRSETRGEQYTIEPSRAWEYYGHLNREITAEILPLKVEDFLKDVPEPAEEQIAELFEEYKHDYAYPNSPDPGFKQRDRVALAYVKADYQQFLTEEKAKITDEEIEKYYYEHLNEYRKPELPPEREPTATESEDPADETSDQTEAEAEATDPENDTSTETEGAPPTDDESASGGEANTTPPVDDPAPEPPVEQESSDGEAAPAPDAPAADGESPDDPGEASGEETTDPNPVAPSDDGARRTTTHGDAVDIHFVTYLGEPADGEAGAEPADGEPEDNSQDQPADDPAPAATETEKAPAGASTTGADEEQKSPSPPQDPAGDDAVKADNTDQPKEAPSAEPTTAQGTDTARPGDAPKKDATDPAASAEPATEGEAGAAEGAPKVEYRSLEEVREQIREDLAAKPAQERLDEALNAILEKTNRYSQERALWEVEKADDPDLPEPQPPNLKPMLKEFGLASGETAEELDIVEMADHELGTAQHTLYVRPRPTTITLAQEAFAKGLPLYQPKRFPPSVSETRFAPRTADEQYVYWKTSETPSHVPELKDVREDVIDAWKHREAVKLAKKAAEEKAQQARESGLSLVSKFGEDKVTETGTFPFYNPISLLMARRGMQAPLLISDVDGVEQPGRNFMRTVFDHEAGDVFTALNQPETHVYVVRMKTDQPSRETLRENFKASLAVGAEPGLPYEVRLLAAQDVGEVLRDWLEKFEEELEVEWKREPELGSQDRI
jgi:hypothetical protein